jgi:hypothetical protein
MFWRDEDCMAMDVHTLMQMSQAQLDDLFTKSAAGPIPDGAAQGTAIIAPGTVFSPAIAQAINFFAWQGKTFDGQHGVLRNRISVLGLNAIVAEVYKGPSWYDKKECIVLDYSKTSTVAGWIRDEMRQLEPGTYLGKVYSGEKPLINFALQFNSEGGG